MEYVDIMVDGQCNSLQETLEEESEDGDKVFEDEALIPSEETELENIIHGQDNIMYEDNEGTQADVYTSDQDCDLDDHANDHDDDLSPSLYGINFHYANGFYCFGHGISQMVVLISV